MDVSVAEQVVETEIQGLLDSLDAGNEEMPLPTQAVIRAMCAVGMLRDGTDLELANDHAEVARNAIDLALTRNVPSTDLILGR
jgi:hypothetical protein